jgi:multicomponent Na+:H+ antiporter subunit D
MSLISNIYLIIFLPLISSLCCLLFKKKLPPFIITLGTVIALLFLVIKILPEIFHYKAIIHDFGLSTISAGLEFKLDLLGVFFLLLLIFSKLIILLYYRSDINQTLTDSNISSFYSVFLLHLFSIVGIFTSNNILNLYVFIEIYSFAFLANFAITRDLNLSKIKFRYYCFLVAAKLIILFAFLIIFLGFGETNFNKIISIVPIISKANWQFLAIISSLIFLSITASFFPFWLYFKKIHSPQLISDFLAFDTLFIKTNIGIYLILRFIYFLFGKDFLFSSLFFAAILGVISLALIFYSAFKLYHQKHLKSIASYLCLNNLGFIIAAIAINKIEALQAALFYIINFSLINIFIFIFATFLKRNYQTSSIIKLANVRKDHFLLILPLKIMIFFIAGFPLTILFLANWHLASISLNYGVELAIIVALIFAILIQINLVTKLIKAFYFNQLSLDGFSQDNNETARFEHQNLKNWHFFYLISFWIIIVAIIYLSLAATSLNEMTLQIANYIIS